MGSIGEWFSSQWQKVTGSTPQQTAAPITQALPTGPDLGTSAEPSGYTSAGGRRFASKKGRSASRKVRGGKRRKTARKH